MIPLFSNKSLTICYGKCIQDDPRTWGFGGSQRQFKILKTTHKEKRINATNSSASVECYYALHKKEKKKIHRMGSKGISSNTVTHITIERRGGVHKLGASPGGPDRVFSSGWSALTTMLMFGLKSASYCTHKAATAAIWIHNRTIDSVFWQFHK